MNKICFLLLFGVACQLLTAQTRDGDVRTLEIGHIRTLHSAILNEDRELNIYLPAGYDQHGTYPVIYLLDGSLDEDFLHITGLCQFFNLMYGMPECIVVGIANVDRQRDFTFPTKLIELKKTYPTTGRSETFIRFLAEELQPFIDSTYPVSTTRYLIGQSLGGLLATEILLKRPELFSHYFIVSPSLWWDNESLLKAAPKLAAAAADTTRYVYISVARLEDPLMQDEAKQLYKIIQDAGKSQTTVEFNPMPDLNHATILHRSIYEAFRGLYPGPD